MLDQDEIDSMAHPLTRIAHAAGRVILDVYNAKIAVRYKNDRSPVTDADERAEAIIVEGLTALLPGVPIIAEELVSRAAIPVFEDEYFLVDPLDGTQAFISCNPEFTVNIALVQNGTAVFGLVYAPGLAECYVTAKGRASYFTLESKDPFIAASHPTTLTGERTPSNRSMTALISPSRFTAQDQACLQSIGSVKTVKMHSSLKFCRLARGTADVYPRFAPTSAWDTAAGQAILEAAGGCVLTAAGDILTYEATVTDFLNPDFVAWRRYPPPA